MAKLALVVMLISLLLTFLPWAQSLEDGSNQVKWAKRVEAGKEVVTNLQFYFHDTLSGRNPSAMRIAQASATNSSLTLFGTVMMADDPLTEGPEPTSKLVGRAQGMYGSAGQEELGLIMAMNYGFKDGIYDGSSFTIVGLNPALNRVREMAIVGGTGLFRLARGYAIAQTYWFDPTSVEPALSSTLVGRAQGLYGTTSLEEICDLMAMSFVFKEGEYNGSSLAVLGHNPIMNQYRELAVVGGSGVFRLARGVVTLNTYFFNPSAGNATVEVSVIVSHY
ncbi:hypothetical protein F0562_020466 [Nyssa sinensis]|uniref:Dirigent protein n=1 Tax=Nyssa sinensis TaxID=561372 RepID=A0A5J5BSN6_9ASTE|nr:hypothetical protein F0562_020466 [Nyssa sinensis]